MSIEAIKRLWPSVQPLVFETDCPEYPYGTAGSLFIVGYKGKAFVITTRHAHNPENPCPICVFPSDTSQRIIPLKDYFFVPRSDVPDDFADFVVVEIDMGKISDPEVGNAILIDLNLCSGDWLSKSDTAEIYVMGYPNEYSYVNFEKEFLVNHRVMLRGRYIGPSDSPYLQELEVLETQNLSTFSGLSGGPVFACIVQGNRGKIIFCGMVLRGTLSSRRIHFIDRSLLIQALDTFLRKNTR